eukprot:CAMPEP_0176212512 /NCGR_PEP_ID=MMETSP0121_2-20121125/15191_1 /TAXON_ID=160619 /ORGANISM="Kryptoperidinium foliaceum, Strain CCMP 1326" /LENGTH=62 /DNA_ID=CAMNT_0017551565 /DNA_START=965 /DNA_END=1149 /DNA_ORIENTATION=+
MPRNVGAGLRNQSAVKPVPIQPTASAAPIAINAHGEGARALALVFRCPPGGCACGVQKLRAR